MSESATKGSLKFKRLPSTNVAIFRFATRRVLRAAILFGVFAGFLVAIQALGYVGSYADEAARKAFAATLASNPALGLLYGSPSHLDIPSGYLVYRCVNILSLVAAIWGLLFITKMLRGQEEDGRWEQLLSGQTTTRRMTLLVVAGALVGLGIAYVIFSAVVIALGQNHTIAIPAGKALFYCLAIMSMALPFMAIGVLTSQLAATRRRAVLYGLVPLLLFFGMREVAVVVSDLSWLHNFTPFGWGYLMHPIFSAAPIWLVPVLGLAAACAAAGIYLAGKRDVGESIIAQSDVAKPHLALVRTPMALALRLTGPVLLAWLVACLGTSTLVAAIAKIAANSTSDSKEISDALNSLSGQAPQNLAIAFVSIASFMAATILMAMVAGGLSAVRNDEGKGYLDNFLVRPVSRARWLCGRLAIILGAATAICVLTGIAVFVVLTGQDITVSASKLILGGLNILGPVVLLLGVGVLLYGLKPRLAVITMYLFMAWSFVIDLTTSVVSLNHFLLDSSLLHYIALVPAANPDWKAFAIITGSGVVLLAAGVVAFTRRDLEAE